MKINKKNFIVGATLLILGLFLLYASFSAENLFQASAGEMGVMAYPRVIVILWIIFSTLLMFSSVEEYDLESLKATSPLIAKATASISLYIILLQYLGVGLSTFIFLMAFFWVMHYASLAKKIIFAILGSILTWGIFTKLLGIIFPDPIWLSFF